MAYGQNECSWDALKKKKTINFADKSIKKRCTLKESADIFNSLFKCKQNRTETENYYITWLYSMNSQLSWRDIVSFTAVYRTQHYMNKKLTRLISQIFSNPHFKRNQLRVTIGCILPIVHRYIKLKLSLEIWIFFQLE